jgi:hypothetical protein
MRRTSVSRARAVSTETTPTQSTVILAAIGLITTLIVAWFIAQ